MTDRFICLVRWAGSVAAITLFAALPAAAQQRIGQAASIQNQVTRVSASGTAGLSVGGSVFRNETIRTAAASAARLVFVDQTDLKMGPASSVVLNRFVFAGGSTARQVGVSLTRGVFRFTTGASDKNAYRITTPVATIGVRGTVLDIQSEGRVTKVTMADNSEALVCANNTRNCLTLAGLGSAVTVTSGLVEITPPGQRFSFQAYCTGGLCGGGGTPDNTGGDMLCGR